MTNMLLTYIAAPYTASSPERVQVNVATATHMGTMVAEAGLSPIMPTRNSYNLDVYGGDNEYTSDPSWWLAATEVQLLVCDAAIFCQGWHHSYGCKQEMQACKDNAIPWFTDLRQLEQWYNDIKEGSINL